jgi:hypothetical protein
MVKKIPSLRFQGHDTRKRRLLAAALRNDGSLSERAKEYSEEDSAKLQLLCLHYGIQSSPSMFYELALELAREIYPEAKKSGRKSKWTELIQAALVVEVERLKRPNDPAHGAEWACEQLAKRKPWKSFIEKKESSKSSPDPAEALRKKYYDFRNDKWADVFRGVFKMHELQGLIDEWEKRVESIGRGISQNLSDWVRNLHPK